MKKFKLLLLVGNLLAGCSPSINLLGQGGSDSGLTVKQDILPGSKGDRQGILPGSKGDRLSALELEVRLPDAGFQAASFKVLAQTMALTVKVDEQTVSSSLSASRNEGSDVVLTLQLQDVPLSQSEMQEFIFTSADGVLQTAGLIPALSADQQRLTVPFDLHSLALWMEATEVQARRGKPLRALTRQALGKLDTLPETRQLQEQLTNLYRNSHGKSDPTKSEQIKSRIKADSQNLLDQAEQTNGSPSSEQTSTITSNGNANGSSNGNMAASTANNGNANGSTNDHSASAPGPNSPPTSSLNSDTSTGSTGNGEANPNATGNNGNAYGASNGNKGNAYGSTNGKANGSNNGNPKS